jgi:uracil phosphoribosyltransferase
LLPYVKCDIKTPSGCNYIGVKNIKGICGVSIMRSGEVMEKGLRESCRCIRIGKILIQTAEEACNKSVIYSKFTKDITMRKILLMYPITSKIQFQNY